MVAESTIGKVAPRLYETKPIINKVTGQPILQRDQQAAIAAGLVDPDSKVLRHGVTPKPSADGNYKNSEYREKVVPTGVLLRSQSLPVLQLTAELA